MARLRNPWGFAQFKNANLYDTGLDDNYGDLVLNWQTINHVGKIKQAIDELTRISSNLVYIINYYYYSREQWIKKYGTQIYEKEYAKLGWCFNIDEVKRYVEQKNYHQLWKEIKDEKFTVGFPLGTTSENTIISIKQPIDYDLSNLATDWATSILEG